MNNELIFEGIFLYGKRNGKGKEFYNQHLIFEGEFINGKRHGKGKEYNIFDGKLLFEGEYKNGKRNGFRKEYFDKNVILFEGENLMVKDGMEKEKNIIIIK